MESRLDAPNCSADTPITPLSTSSHARSRGRVVTTLAAGLSAVALAGVAFAAPATAAPYDGVWDRVASCESSQDWHIDTGNGYYGGLQFSSGTWLGFGGGKYAARADLASRAQQIEVARRVLAGQGPGAWPVCGPRAGLTQASGGATSAPLPAVAGQDGQPRRKHVRKHVRKASHKPVHKTSPKPAGNPSYQVQPGDTLIKIARRLGIEGGWATVFQANHGQIGNPNLIRVGQILSLPR